MKRRSDFGPLSRPIHVERLPRDRAEVTVDATPEECVALAADFGIVGIRDLVGRFAVSGSMTRLHVGGVVEALVTQICSVSLEPFETPLRETVDVDFTSRDALAGTDAEDADLPDPIVNGRIDFGALTAEHLALGLDPYPRKPGIAFEPVVAKEEKPLATLRRLRPGEEPSG